MWQGEILAGIAGLCGGAVVAVALAAFIIELGIIPRFAGITHTANHIFLYENCLMLGSFWGNLIYIYHLSVPFGKIFAGVTGFFFGMFLGGWIIALVEVVNVFAVMDWMDCNLYCSRENTRESFPIFYCIILKMFRLFGNGTLSLYLRKSLIYLHKIGTYFTQ